MKTESTDRSSGLPGDSRAPATRARVWCFRIIAIVIGLAPFVASELVLRWLDLANPNAQIDPLAGFSRRHPLFERAGANYRTVRSREPFFGPQEFAAKKPANAFRIFCFGGSTVHGHPYLNATAFPKWLEIELSGRDPSRRFEVLNCGGVSYASYRLAPIVHEVCAYQPDLIILAMGHNEFLEDRTFQPLKARSAPRRWLEDQYFSLRMVSLAQQILGRDRPVADLALTPEVAPRLDEAAGYASYVRDDAWQRRVVYQFADAERKMLAECSTAHVPVLIVALGSNLRDHPPFKSEHRAGLSAGAESHWESLFDRASRSELTNLNAAVSFYLELETIDGDYALLSYRLAKCFDRLGRPEQAREYYLRAKDLDVCPLRMLESISSVQRRIAAETGTPFVDAQKLLESLSPEGLPGNDVYLDHVHPTIGAHQKIAHAIVEKMQAALGLGITAWSEPSRRAAYQAHLAKLEPTYFSNGRRRVEWLEHWAQRQRWFGETLPKDARGFLHQGFRALELENEAAAWKAFRQALAADPLQARPLAEHVEELRSEGRPEAADRLLEYLKDLANDLNARSSAQSELLPAAD